MMAGGDDAQDVCTGAEACVLLLLLLLVLALLLEGPLAGGGCW
jgi:hypothetical protein